MSPCKLNAKPTFASRAARFACVLFVSSAIACGSDLTDNDGDGIADGVVEPNNINVVSPTKPVGYVTGEVRDGTTDLSLGGAMVTLLGGSVPEERVTDSNGSFQFGPVAASDFSLRVTLDGYVDALVTGLTIDDSAGDFPRSNATIFVGPVRLLPTTGRFTVQVVSEAGSPVQGAEVTVETGVRYFLDEAARSTAHGTATTDADGRVTVDSLPDVWKIPPSKRISAGIVVSVAPVDLDGDDTPDLSGTTVAYSGEEVRDQALVPVIVLERPGESPLVVVASNLPGLKGAPASQPSLIDENEAIRLVFNKPIDRDSLLIDLMDEDGSTDILTSVVTGAFDNIVAIEAADTLTKGQEYNIAIRVQSRDTIPVEILHLKTPFFISDDPGQSISISSRFVDVNDDNAWGTGLDEITLTVTTPVGRAGASPGFRVELFVELDLNGTSTIGDATGELPTGGLPYPAPIVLESNEPSAPNGAGVSGFTRFINARRISLATPRTTVMGAVNFEIRFPPSRNSNQQVTTPSGRQAPERFTGSATLVSP